MVFALAAGHVCAPAWAGQPWLTPEDYDKLHVVASLDMSEPEQYAVRRFRMHWSGLTGHEPTLGPRPDPSKVNVWIGAYGLAGFPQHIDVSGLSQDGYVMRTIGRRDGVTPDNDGRHLLLAGGGDRGTLYAEWAFFEQYAGARLFGPDLLRWPDAPASFPTIDDQYDPPFWYRDVSYRPFMEYPWVANFNRLNGYWSRVPKRWGGRIRYVGGASMFAHTFHKFVDPEVYFDDHPEYFAEIDGERVKYAQLCLTNPDVLAITIDKVRQLLRNSPPGERIVSISQMDYFWFDSWCTCPTCRAIDEREGSHAGTIIHFVNQVAEAIEDEFPDAYISTLAYLYSQKPPKHIRPRKNVIVRLSAVQCDYSTPMSDRRSASNRAFVHDLKAWRRIAPTLFVWDYTQNWYAFQAPYPNIHVLQPNLEFLAKQGVDGVYEQASPYSPHSDFEMLKSYLLAQSVWNPKLNWREAYHEFLKYYYGEAAPYIDEYVQLLTDRVREPGVELHFVDGTEWMDYGLVETAQAIFERAFEQVTDETARERLKFAYLPVQYAALVCPPRVYQKPDAYVFARPPSQTFDEYWAMLMDYGVTHLNDYPIDAFRDRLHGETPPRYEVAPIEKKRIGDTDFWVVPDRGGALVRWRQRDPHKEWLSGYDAILQARGRIQDWAATDPDRWIDPDPLDLAYSVVEQTPDTIKLRAELDNGLVLQRHMTFGEDSVEVHLTVRNDAAESRIPKAGVYGEFGADGLGRGRLWSGAGDAWVCDPFPSNDETGARERTYNEPGSGSWALRFPVAHWAFRFDLVDGKARGVEFVDDPERDLVRIGADLPRDPLAPGEERSFTVRYTITRDRPYAR